MGVVSTKGDTYMLHDMPYPYRYNHCNITTVERTAWHIRYGKWGLFFIMLFFILQKRDYILQYHKDTTSITQQKSLTSTHKLLHKSSHQTSTKDPMMCPQTLIGNASTSSSLHTRKPNQDIILIYILNILHHLLLDPHLKPQRALPFQSSKSCIKIKRNKSTTPLKSQTKTYLSQNHIPCIPQPPHQEQKYTLHLT